MNNRQRQIYGLCRPDTIPRLRRTHNKRQFEWYVFVDGRMERGDIEYVCAEFAKMSLYYPYHLKGKEIDGWEHHQHEFASVLSTLIDSPEIFSVCGFEEYYSEQQIFFLDSVQKRLLELRDSGIAEDYEDTREEDS